MWEAARAGGRRPPPPAPAPGAAPPAPTTACPPRPPPPPPPAGEGEAARAARDVYWAAEPLYYASRATGLATFRYAPPGGGGPRLRTSPWAVAYALLLSAALLACLGMYVARALRHGYGDTRTLVVHVGMRALVYLCMFASVFLGAVVHPRAPREALAAVAAADAALWAPRHRERACRRARACAAAQVAAAALFYGGYAVADVATQWGRYRSPSDWAFHFVPHLAPHVFNVVMLLQYSNWLLLLLSRMRALNRRLAALCPADARALLAAHARPRSGRAEAHPTARGAAAAGAAAAGAAQAEGVRRLQGAHVALCAAAARVDAALGVPVLLETCYLAAELVSRAYALYRTGLARHALWLGVSAVRLATAAVPAHACGAAARRAAELLARASLAPPPDARARAALRDFARHALLHPMRFSAAGVFAVDASLLFNALVAAATYIIIALQFECGHADE